LHINRGRAGSEIVEKRNKAEFETLVIEELKVYHICSINSPGGLPPQREEINDKMNNKIRLAFALLLVLCIGLSGCGTDSSETEAVTVYVNRVYSLERNDILLHLDCTTAADSEAEDNILLIHGLTYSSHEFDVDYQDYSLVHFLCNNGYAVWRLDIAGYGQSEKAEDGFAVDSEYASEDICAAIEKILEITEAEDVDLLGWSWGTVTCSLAEQKLSSKIDKLVLYAPIITGLGEAEIEDDYHINSWEHAASDFQTDDDGSIDEDMVDMAVVNVYCSNCWRYDKESSPNGGRRDLCVDPEVRLIDLSEIKSPTLVICGDKDPYLNMPLVEASESILPEGSKLEIVSGAAHAMYIEKPFYRLFQRKLIEYLLSE